MQMEVQYFLCCKSFLVILFFSVKNLKILKFYNDLWKSTGVSDAMGGFLAEEGGNRAHPKWQATKKNEL